MNDKSEICESKCEARRKGMFDLKKYTNVKAIKFLKEEQEIYSYQRPNELENSCFAVGCIFKSFLAALVGIAIYEGRIQSIEDCVLDYFSHDENIEMNWYKLKIKHVLSKTTGIKWPGPQEPLPADIREVMRLPFENEPGTFFQYKPDPQISVYLLEEVYGMEITKLFQDKLVAYFRNHTYEWNREDIQGMKVSSELLCEFGQLIMNKGIIYGKRLFTEEYYEQMVTAYSSGGFPECSPYGLSWWIGQQGQERFIRACGFGGQMLAIYPAKKIVMSIFSDMDRPHPENLQILSEAFTMCE